MIRVRGRSIRRVAGLPVVAWWTIGVAGAAWAAWLVLLGVSGSVRTTTMSVVYGTANTNATPAGGGTCTASRVSDTNVALTWTEAVEGSTCKLTVSAVNMGTTPVRLQGFELASAGFAGGAVTASVGTFCGLSLAGGQAVSAIDAWLTVTAASSPGTTLTFDPTLDGFLWVPATRFDSAACS